MIRVVVVDDEPLVCLHLRTILSSVEDIDVVDQAHDGAAAVVRREPHVVLMDLKMPGVDGLTAIERIATMPKRPAVVALTTFDADQYVLRAMRAGSAGFLLKTTRPGDLIDLVRVAAAGHTVLSPEATARLVAAQSGEHRARQRAGELVSRLSERETEVLGWLGLGLTNAEIARRLHLSLATIKGYVGSTLAKLECANRTEASRLAYDAGLVTR